MILEKKKKKKMLHEIDALINLFKMNDTPSQVTFHHPITMTTRMACLRKTRPTTRQREDRPCAGYNALLSKHN